MYFVLGGGEDGFKLLKQNGQYPVESIKNTDDLVLLINTHHSISTTYPLIEQPFQCSRLLKSVDIQIPQQ